MSPASDQVRLGNFGAARDFTAPDQSLLASTGASNPLLAVLCVAIIVAGLVLRFWSIDSKPIWCDEASTLVSIKEGDGVGIPSQMTTAGQAAHLVKISQPLNVPVFFQRLKFQRSPNTPLYFFVSRLWAQCFGNTVQSARRLSALISLAQLPCVFWLAIELFGCLSVACICSALCAISPLHLIYAQEARPYSLWTVTVLLGALLLLRAWRKNSVGSWWLYAISQVIAYYTHPASVILTATHGAAILVGGRNRLVPFLLAATTAMLACLPWVLGADPARDNMRAFHTWSSTPTVFLDLLKGWISAIAVTFFDYNDKSKSWWTIATQSIAAAVGVFSIWYTCRRARAPAPYLLPILFPGYFLAVAALDFTLGGFKSTVPRYMIPLALGVQIAVAFLLARQFASASKVRRILSFTLAGCLVFSGLSSCLLFSKSKLWWQKQIDPELTLAQFLNADKGTTMWICERPQTALTAAPLVRPDIPLMIVGDGELVSNPNSYRRIIVSSGNNSLVERIAAEQGLTAHQCPGTRNGWLLTPDRSAGSKMIEVDLPGTQR